MLTINVGHISVAYNVTIKNDNIPEPTETFHVLLRLVSGISVAVNPTQSIANVTIIDTDRKHLLLIPLGLL